MRSVRAVARDRDIDQLRIDLAQFLPTEAVLLGRTGPEVLAEDVGLRDELAQDLAPLLALEVQGHALHAAIVGFEEGAAHVRQHGHAARRVAALGRFDLDHVGAEIGHQHPGHGARLRGGAGDDLDALKRAVGNRHRRGLLCESPTLEQVQAGVSSRATSQKRTRRLDASSHSVSRGAARPARRPRGETARTVWAAS